MRTSTPAHRCVRHTIGLCAAACLLLAAAGCEPETVEESQARRMHEMSGQSYAEQQQNDHPAIQGEPMILPADRDPDAPVAP